MRPARVAFRPTSMSHSKHPFRRMWHRLADAFGRFLNGLLMLSVAIIVFPVTLQIVSRWTTALIRTTSGPRRWRGSCSSG